LAAGVAAGDAEVVGALGAAVFVGALVVQPEAVSSTAAATSASGDLKIVFINSMLINLLRLLQTRLPWRPLTGRVQARMLPPNRGNSRSHT
jgi:hypothetical protein